MSFIAFMTRKHVHIFESAILLFYNTQIGNLHFMKELFEKEYSIELSKINALIDILEKSINAASLEQMAEYKKVYDNLNYLRYDDESNVEFSMTCTVKDLEIFSICLDFYSRIFIGQFNEMRHLFYKSENQDDIEIFLLQLRNAIFPDLNCGFYGSYGITNSEVHINAKIAYEMYKVIRKQIWIERGCTPEYCTDSYDPLRLSKEPLLIIEKIRRSWN